MTYSEKLQSPKWQKKRLEILNRDNFTCRYCTDDSQSLHIHHKKYNYNSNPWDIENEHLITVCKDCHTIIELFKKDKIEVLTIQSDYLKNNGIKTFAVYCIDENIRFVYLACKKYGAIEVMQRISEQTISNWNKTLKAIKMTNSNS